MKRLYAVADIQRLVKVEHQTELILAPGDLITPAAVDEAARLGLKIQRPATVKPGAIPTEAEVRRVVLAILERADGQMTVEEIVRAVVARFLGRPPETVPSERIVIRGGWSDIVTEGELRQRLHGHQKATAIFRRGTRFTPAAQDLLKAWQIEVKWEE